MVIELTKAYKKPNGKLIAKGTRIKCLKGHQYKDFVLVNEDGTIKKEVKTIKEKG